MGNRASRLLALQLRKEQSGRIVSKIKHLTSLIEVSHTEEVAEAFKNVYKKLYDTPEETQNKRKLEVMFKNLNLAKLSVSEADKLIAPI